VGQSILAQDPLASLGAWLARPPLTATRSDGQNIHKLPAPSIATLLPLTISTTTPSVCAAMLPPRIHRSILFSRLMSSQHKVTRILENRPWMAPTPLTKSAYQPTPRFLFWFSDVFISQAHVLRCVSTDS